MSAISQENVAVVEETAAFMQELNASVHLVADLAKGSKETSAELGKSMMIQDNEIRYIVLDKVLNFTQENLEYAQNLLN